MQLHSLRWCRSRRTSCERSSAPVAYWKQSILKNAIQLSSRWRQVRDMLGRLLKFYYRHDNKKLSR